MMNMVLSILLAVALCGVSFFVDVTPQFGGGVSLEGWWLAAFGIAVLPQAFAKHWGRRTAFLGSTFLIASAGWLALTRPIWLHEFHIRPHHFREWPNQLAAGCIALQGVTCALGLMKDRLLLRTLVSHALSRRSFLVVGILLLTCSAHFTLLYPNIDKSNFQAHFAAQILVALIMGAFGLINLALIYRAVSLRAEGAPLASSPKIATPWSEETGTWDGRLPWLLASATTLVSASIAYFAFERLPHIPDGIAYLFQARAIGAGAFGFEQLPLPEAFQIYLIDHRDGLSFSITNPGWPMVLAIGEYVGAAWLVNPILAGLTVLLLHRWLKKQWGVGWANVMVSLLSISPWFLFLAASHMTHIATMLFFVAGNLLASDAAKHRRTDKGFMAGLCLGMVFLIRPLDGLLLGGFTGLYLLVTGLRRAEGKLKDIVAFSLGAILVSSVLLMFNHALTGDAFATPTNTYIAEIWPDSTNRLGFGEEVGNPPSGWGELDPIRGHGWRDVLLNSNQNMANMNVELFGWTTGSLMLLAFFFFFAKRWSTTDRIALGSMVVLFLGYNLYWFSGGPDFGPRYWFSMLIPLLWLSARGLTLLIDRLRQADARAPERIAVVAWVLVLGGLAVFMSWRGASRYVEYRGFHSDYRQLMDEGAFGNAVVFIDTPQEVDYACAFLLNSFPIDQDGPIFVRDLGVESNAAIMGLFRGKPAVFVDGRAKTGSRAQIRLR